VPYVKTLKVILAEFSLNAVYNLLPFPKHLEPGAASFASKAFTASDMISSTRLKRIHEFRLGFIREINALLRPGKTRNFLCHGMVADTFNIVNNMQHRGHLG